LNKIKILDIEIDGLETKSLVERLASLASNISSGPIRVIQVNPEIVVAANYSESINKLVRSADFKLANGAGIQWAANYNKQAKKSFFQLVKSLFKIFTQPKHGQDQIPELFNSSSFTEVLLNKLSEQKSKVLIAASPKRSNIDDSLAFLRNKHQGLDLIGFDSGNFDEQSLLDLTALVKTSSPDLVLLGLGFPLQESVAEKLKSEISHGAIVTEGGTFDYESFGGKVKRAPKIFQSIGLEWFWRLAKEPVRLKRQLALLEFIKLVYRKNKMH
jgi:N-acetylglucosaminyldiphosphoundecaprenol N-acetyl-beta-D-mannosaminyltransferase